MKTILNLKKISLIIIVLIFWLIAGKTNVYAEQVEAKNSGKIERLEAKLYELKAELKLMYTYKESFELGAANYQDPKAVQSCEKQLSKADRKSGKLAEKIRKKQAKLDSLME